MILPTKFYSPHSKVTKNTKAHDADLFCTLQKMNSLRIEADEAATQVEDMKSKVKSLEQENLAKEQEITSLQHKNQLLESEVEKLEGGITEHKKAAEENVGHGTQNEHLQRRLQLLEEEAEEADKNLRETNDK
jgi:tropomyosin, fungi type